MTKFELNQCFLELRDTLGKLEIWPLCSITFGNSIVHFNIQMSLGFKKHWSSP
jgi:hypothetical protein